MDVRTFFVMWCFSGRLLEIQLCLFIIKSPSFIDNKSKYFPSIKENRISYVSSRVQGHVKLSLSSYKSLTYYYFLSLEPKHIVIKKIIPFFLLHSIKIYLHPSAPLNQKTINETSTITNLFEKKLLRDENVALCMLSEVELKLTYICLSAMIFVF